MLRPNTSSWEYQRSHRSHLHSSRLCAMENSAFTKIHIDISATSPNVIICNIQKPHYISRIHIFIH